MVIEIFHAGFIKGFLTKKNADFLTEKNLCRMVYPDVRQGSLKAYLSRQIKFHYGDTMNDFTYRSWKEFGEQQNRKSKTFQLSIDELERDLYFDDSEYKRDLDDDELFFDD
jgi:hypothetical protein